MSKLKDLYYRYEEVILYLFFGAITTLVNIISFQISYELMKIDLLIANIIAWVISVFVAYITNRIFVFKSKAKGLKANLKEIISFFIARVLSLGIDSAIIYIGIDILKFNSLIIKIVSNVVVIICNYILSKLIIFKK